MSVADISDEKLAEVEAAIREDMAKVVASGVGWNPFSGATVLDGKWVDVDTRYGARPCGVCAIGAVCVSRQPPIRDEWGDIDAAAEALGVEYSWCNELYMAVATRDAEPSGYSAQVWSLSRRLRAYGDELMAARSTPPRPLSGGDGR